MDDNVVKAVFCKACKQQTTNVNIGWCDNCWAIYRRIDGLNIYATEFFLKAFAERFTNWPI